MSRKKPLPWPSAKAFWNVLMLAFVVAPWLTVAALYTIASGKRVRAWNQLCSLAEEHPRHYQYWSKHVIKQRKQAFVGDAKPITGLVLQALSETCDEALASLFARLGREGYSWAVFHAEGDLVDHDLAAVLAAALQSAPDAAIFYWDEEWASSNDELTPWIKPDWSERLHMARDVLTGASAISVVEAIATLDGCDKLRVDNVGLTLLALALGSNSRPPQHLPLVLTRRTAPEARLQSWARAARAIWPDWGFAVRDDAISFLRVTPPDPPVWPAVTIIIPTRDRVDLLRNCVGGLDRTVYQGRIEIIIVDNGSVEPESLAYLAELENAEKVRVLRDEGPFNFSRLNNRAAVAASGDFLCLLNNDIETLEADWLTAMVKHAVQPGIGAVGAQLLYPDGSIQHAGVVIGVGDAAGHIQRGVDPANAENAAWHAVTREVSAVTAACLLVAKSLYEIVGGLDEAGFAVAFNDVDFCLKLGALGLANIYCTEARLIHAESRSRPLDNRADQIARFERELSLLQSRWRTPGFRDPCFSPLFSPSAEKCLLRAT